MLRARHVRAEAWQSIAYGSIQRNPARKPIFMRASDGVQGSKSDSQCRSIDRPTIPSRGNYRCKRVMRMREMACGMHKERAGGVHHEKTLRSRSLRAVALQQS